MDRAVVFWVLLLVAATWLLYKLAVLLAPRSDPSAGVSSHSSQKLIHQRLRK